MQLFSFILFFALVFLVFYLPGRLLLRLSGYKFTNFLVTFSSSLIVGVASFLFFTYILSWIGAVYIYNLIIPFAFFLEYKNSYSEFKKYIKIKNFINTEALIIFSGTVAMAFTTWNSGIYKNGELLFYGVNGGDSIYHLALIGSLISSFPPFHPGLAGVPLRGYHIFYDFLIANFALFYRFSSLDLFFRYFPLLIALLLGISSLSLAKFLKWGKITALLFIFFMYFVQSFDFFASYLYKFFNYYYNSAGITQSLANALDPSVVVSVSFIFVGFILLFSKGKKWSSLLPILVIGVISQIKIYSGIIYFSGLLPLALWELYKNRNTDYLKILIGSGIISALVYLPINYGSGELVWAPLVMYKNFIDSAWIFNFWHSNTNYPIYVQSKNYAHIAFFYIVAISIFLITSLGIRIIIFLDFKKVFKKKFYTGENIFWFTGILFSFLIPSLFIQSVSVFQTIQFFWVGYILLLIPSAIVLGKRLERRNKVILTASFLFLVLLFLPDTVRTLWTYYDRPGIISPDIVRQAAIINKIPQKEGIIVLNRIKLNNKYQDTSNVPIVSALSGHSVYYEHELTSFQGLDKIVDKRKMTIDKIAENMVNCNNPITAEENIINVMRNSNNMYLLILDKNQCTEKFNKLKIVNEEKNSILYKI